MHRTFNGQPVTRETQQAIDELESKLWEQGYSSIDDYGRNAIEVTESIVYPRAKQSRVISCPGVVFIIDNVGHFRYNLTIRG